MARDWGTRNMTRTTQRNITYMPNSAALWKDSERSLLPKALPHTLFLGGPVRDYRICTDDPHGSYADEAEKNFQLRLGIPFDDIRRVYCEELQRADEIIRSYSRIHPLVFTHSNLAQHNIMVDNGRVTGIVHWECTGWYPTYWEYLKALFTEPCDIEWRTGIHNFLTPFQFEADIDARFG